MYTYTMYRCLLTHILPEGVRITLMVVLLTDTFQMGHQTDKPHRPQILIVIIPSLLRSNQPTRVFNIAQLYPYIDILLVCIYI